MSHQEPPVRAHHRVWPRRLPHALRPPQTSLWENLAVSARRYPDKAALVFFDRVTTYAGLHEQAERLAAHLRAQGVRDGDRVILFLQNCPQWIVACYAVLRANAVVVPVNPMNKADELGHYITDADARVAVCAADLAGELLKANAEVSEAQRLRHLVVTHYADAIGPMDDPDAVAGMPRPGRVGWARGTNGPRCPAAAWPPGPRPWPAPRRCPSTTAAPTTWPCCPTPAAPPACPRAASTRTAR